MAGIDSVKTEAAGGGGGGGPGAEAAAAAAISWDDPAPDQNMYNSIKDLQR